MVWSPRLGKGLASAALGALLQARGYTVRLRKLDPYLNVDPGTMSPFEHGEVFVTDDGAETDLDLGHYERFTGVAARKTDSVSSGRIYSTVLEKERRGDYLGKTIQVIPHVTNEIKDFLHIGEDEVDFQLCEIGGTVGDIEGLPFFEAIRQFAQEQPRGECIFMHLTLLPWIAAAGELKTKPTQHSVKELRSIGLAPDVLVCRSDHPIPDKERAKIALFCNVREDSVIAAPDLTSIYDAPLAYHRNGLDQAVLDAFGIAPAPRPNLARWEDVADRIHNAEGEVRIAIVGKYTQLGDAYKSIAEALTHGGMANRVRVRAEWLDAEIFEREDPSPWLEGFHAILVPGGFGERGTEGKIRAAQFAREHEIPYLGICLGMQMAVVEAARNLAGMDKAGSQEFDHEAGSRPVRAGDLPPQGMDQGQPEDRPLGARRQGRHHAPWRLHRLPARGLQGGRDLRRAPRSRSATATATRSTSSTASSWRSTGLCFSGMSPGRPPARDRRGHGPPLVHRRPVPPRAEVQTLRPPPPLRRFRPRGGGGEQAGVERAR